MGTPISSNRCRGNEGTKQDEADIRQQQPLPAFSFSHLQGDSLPCESDSKNSSCRSRLISCGGDRETDIIDDYYEDEHDKERDDHKNHGWSRFRTVDDDGGSTTETSMKFNPILGIMDDQLLSEDILSCISALDEVIAEFDDPSLPYMNEDEGKQETGTTMPVHDDNEFSPSSAVTISFPNPSTNNNQIQSQNQSMMMMMGAVEQIQSQSPQQEDDPSSQNQNAKRDETQDPVTAIVRPNQRKRSNVTTESDVPRNNANANSVSPTSSGGGGTYSKGTSREVLLDLPRISPETASNSSQMNSNSSPKLGNEVASSAHLSFPSRKPQQCLLFDADPFDSKVSVVKVGGTSKSHNGSSSGQQHGKSLEEQQTPPCFVSKAAVAVTNTHHHGASPSGAVVSKLMKEEMWNFPSEKNLPRSLRKTRRTVQADEENEVSSNEDCGSQRHKVSAVGADEASRIAARECGVDQIRDQTVMDTHASSNSNGSAKGGGASEWNKSEQGSLSNFTVSSQGSHSSFKSGSGAMNDLSVPKTRLRQQIPKEGEELVMFPPLIPSSSSSKVRTPKPNPRPGKDSTSPPGLFSPPAMEISKTDVRCESSTSPALPVKYDGPQNMMRMMIMTPNGQNPGSGSASISRSSSSTSSSAGCQDGEGNGDQKSTSLSTSSGIFVTNTSTTTSPTHSMNNNSLPLKSGNNNNNNVIIMSTEEGIPEVKRRVHPRPRANMRMPPHAQPRNNGQYNSTFAVVNNGNGSTTIEVDDGYLSMINKNEASHLWPEEMIENETFSPDELKRLSIHVLEEEEGQDETNTSSNTATTSQSDSEGDGGEIELEIVSYDKEPSRRKPGHKKTAHSYVNRHQHQRQYGEEQKEYFSDDSLEGDHLPDERRHSRGNKNHRFTPNVSSSFANNSPHQQSSHYYNQHPKMMEYLQGDPFYPQQQVTVNTAFIHESPHITSSGGRGNPNKVSRIPKMVSGTSHNSNVVCPSPKGGKVKPQPMSQGEPYVKKKPCSFFISLNDKDSSTSPKIPAANLKSSSSLVPSTSPKAGTGQPTATSSSPPSVPSLPSPSSSSQPTPQLNSPSKPLFLGISPYSPIRRSAKKKAGNNAVTVETNSQNVEKISPQSADLMQAKDSGCNDGSANNKVKSRPNNKLGSNLPLPTHSHKHSKPTNNGENKEHMQQNQPTTDGPANNNNNISHQKNVQNVQANEGLIKQNDHNNQLNIASNDEVDNAVATTSPPPSNRTSTLLIPSPCSNRKEGEMHENLTKRQTDDDDDNNESDTSVTPDNDFGDFDLVLLQPPDEIDSIQPEISFTDVHNFVSEIMDTALRQEIKRAQMERNNYPTSGDYEWASGDFFDPENDRDEKSPSPVTKTAASRHMIDDEQGQDEKAASLKNALSPEEQIVETLGHAEDFNIEEGQPCDDGHHSPKERTQTESPKPVSFPEVGKMIQEETTMDYSDRPALSLNDTSLRGEGNILESNSGASDEEDSEEQPPQFIPTPPPKLTPMTSNIPDIPHHHINSTLLSSGTPYQFPSGNLKNGKTMLDILAERIKNSKRFPDDEDQIPVSHFIHDKRNIWAMYDRPFDEDLLTVNHGARGYASKSQENLVDAMTREKFHKSFSGRGQSSTLPLNCRPPPAQRRSSTFRNMINKFRKSKLSGPVPSISESTEYRDEEAQSIASRETGASDQGKKRGFFSRLFRRSRKN